MVTKDTTQNPNSEYKNDLKPLYEAYSALGLLQERAKVDTSPPAILVVGHEIDGKSGASHPAFKVELSCSTRRAVVHVE